MKHWHIEQVGWDRFDPGQVDPGIVPLVKAAAMVERNGDDYAIYLCNVFHDDPDFQQAARNWAVEEVQHGEALGRWAMLADPSWDYQAAFARFREGYKIPVEVDHSVRGSRTGELIARCMVETGTSSYYTALGEGTAEPVLQRYGVSDDDAFAWARRAAREEGILCGISSGAALCAANQVAHLPQNKGKTIITILASAGERYMSTPLFEAAS